MNKVVCVVKWLCFVYGSNVVISIVFKCFELLKNYLRVRLSISNIGPHKYGKWAVITGGTDGIGLEFSRKLAKRGFNVLIISRNKQKLERVCTQLKNYNVTTDYVVADFKKGKSIYDDIRKKITDMDVGILVNNVGMGPKTPSCFGELTESELWDTINVNICSMVMMTHIILPNMLKEKKGAIINMSSISAIHPVPLLQVYSATKVFVDYITLSLQWEYKQSGVTFLSLIPSYISTSLFRDTKLSKLIQLVTPTPDDYVTHALPLLGLTDHTTGYWLHEIQAIFLSCMPQKLGSHILGQLQLIHNNTS